MLFERKNSRKGFSLVELLIVIAILGVVATIAIPILLNARNQAVDDKALGCLRTVVSAEFAYYAAVGSYGDFTSLETGGYIDNRFAANNLGNGITITTSPVGGGQTFTCVITGATTTYSADETGLITAS